MKLGIKQYRWGMKLAAGILVLVVLWAGRELLRTGEMQRAIETRRAVGRLLAHMEYEAQALAQVADVWAVSGAMSEEIRQTISGAVSQVAFPEPHLLGDLRLHTAEVAVDGGALGTFLERLGKMQALPVRVLRLELVAGATGDISGSIVVGWLEAL